MSDVASHLVKEALAVISDWYIPESDPLDGFIYPKAQGIRPLLFLHDTARRLLDQCMDRTATGYDEFVVRVHERSYRGHRIETVSGPYFALRRMPTTIPTLESLGLNKSLRQVLMSPGLNKGGLILICGETGQGKSTTCAATIRERMIELGSFTLTVEDPPEMPLHGIHGTGRCLQTEVKSGNFADAMRGAMRCYPTVNGSILYVGETRDSESAAEVLRIAMNGNLVFTTLHAQDVPSALRRLLSLASTRMGEDEAATILATVFRVGMHQTLESVRAIAGKQALKKLSVEFLLSDSARSPVANKIKKREMNGLGTDIQQQKVVLDKNGAEALMSMWKL